MVEYVIVVKVQFYSAGKIKSLWINSPVEGSAARWLVGENFPLSLCSQVAAEPHTGAGRRAWGDVIHYDCIFCRRVKNLVWYDDITSSATLLSKIMEPRSIDPGTITLTFGCLSSLDLPALLFLFLFLLFSVFSHMRSLLLFRAQWQKTEVLVRRNHTCLTSCVVSSFSNIPSWHCWQENWPFTIYLTVKTA